MGCSVYTKLSEFAKTFEYSGIVVAYGRFGTWLVFELTTTNFRLAFFVADPWG